MPGDMNKKKPTLLYIMGGLGCGKTTLIDALIELSSNPQNAHTYSLLDKDEWASTLKIKQSTRSKLFATAELDQDSLYCALAKSALKDTGSPEKIRIITGNFAQRFLSGVIPLSSFLEKFNILIVRVTSNDSEINWQRVNARFKRGEQIEKDKSIAENPIKFKKRLAEIIALGDRFISFIEPHINSGQIRYKVIDNSIQFSTHQQFLEKAQEIQDFISEQITPIFMPRRVYPPFSNSNYQLAESQGPITPPREENPRVVSIEPIQPKRSSSGGIIFSFLQKTMRMTTASPLTDSPPQPEAQAPNRETFRSRSDSGYRYGQ